MVQTCLFSGYLPALIICSASKKRVFYALPATALETHQLEKLDSCDLRGKCHSKTTASAGLQISRTPSIPHAPVTEQEERARG